MLQEDVGRPGRTEFNRRHQGGCLSLVKLKFPCEQEISGLHCKAAPPSRVPCHSPGRGKPAGRTGPPRAARRAPLTGCVERRRPFLPDERG